MRGQEPMYLKSVAHGITIRRITAAVSWALLFHLSLGFGFDGSATCENSSHADHSAVAVDHQHGVPSDQEHPGMSCAASFGGDCLMPAGGSSTCNTNTSCGSVIPESLSAAPDEDIVVARRVVAESLASPRGWLSAPDHPPPRA
jgi:hypothetical protein